MYTRWIANILIRTISLILTIQKTLKNGMKITLKYFGVIAEIMGSEIEVLNIKSQSMTIMDLNELIVEKNNLLKDQHYKFAVNQTMIDENIVLKENDEIALLPPFSGG